MQCNRKIKDNNKGFTLVELIITVVILALVAAPFLSSFATAANTNAKSKRIQEANELSQYIIERFKNATRDLSTIDATDLSTYGLTYDAATNTYTAAVSDANGNLPAGYSKQYTADIKITANASDINNYVTPEVTALTHADCAVFSGIITRYDSCFNGASTGTRDVTITIKKNMSDKYEVSISIICKDALANPIGGLSAPATITYDTLPAIYVLYPPHNPLGDTISVKNELPDTEELQVYIVHQDGTSTTPLTSDHVKIYESGAEKSLRNLIDGLSTLTHTVLYTNEGNMSTATVDPTGRLKRTVKTIKVETLYDIEVNVKYLGKTISTVKATNITVD